jgi:hypothetical protein
LKEVFQPSPEVFSQAIAVDVITAELWLAVLLFGVARSAKLTNGLAQIRQQWRK